MITVADANLVAITRICGVTFEDLARGGRLRPLTYSRHRQRAEAALATTAFPSAS